MKPGLLIRTANKSQEFQHLWKSALFSLPHLQPTLKAQGNCRCLTWHFQCLSPAANSFWKLKLFSLSEVLIIAYLWKIPVWIDSLQPKFRDEENAQAFTTTIKHWKNQYCCNKSGTNKKYWRGGKPTAPPMPGRFHALRQCCFYFFLPLE